MPTLKRTKPLECGPFINVERPVTGPHAAQAGVPLSAGSGGGAQLPCGVPGRIISSPLRRCRLLFSLPLRAEPCAGEIPPPGTNYFSFALVGIAFFDHLSIGLITFDQSLQEARQNGTLENFLVTQTSLPVILAGSSLYPFALMSLRTAIYIGWGAILFGFPLGGANWLGAILVLAASVLAFSGLGILSASHLLVFKRGNPVIGPSWGFPRWWEE
jgi:hypothetical protein